MIPIPPKLQHRPRWRGLPVPFVTLIGADGAPDFRASDEARRRESFTAGICQLCGQKLGRYFFFVGGTEAAKAMGYFEPATHLECCIYAMQVCPFILGKMEHADIAKVNQRHEGTGITVVADDTLSSVRNPHWVIVKATDYDVGRTPDGTVLVLPRGVVCQTNPLHAETMNAADWERVSAELFAAK